MKLQAKSSDFRLFKNLPSFILKAVLSSILFLIFMRTLFSLKGVPFSYLVSDPNAFSGMPPYIGMITLIGILIWCASGAISIFVAWILPKDNQTKSINWSQFLFFSGCITMFLVFDDLFQIHEYYYLPFIDLDSFENPRPIQLFFQGSFFLMYVILISIHFYRFRMVVKKSNYNILNLSILFFGVSIILDIATSESMPFYYFLEEGSKFTGIVIWFSYFLDCCYQQIQKFVFNKNYFLSDWEN
jgi:hypothetical protein